MKRIAKALLGSLLLFAIALGGRYLIAEWYIKRAIETVQQSFANLQRNSQLQMQAIKDRQAAEQEQQRLIALQKQQADDAAARANTEKEKAWNAYYKEPKGCDNWHSDAEMVKCVNYKMNERQKFETLWSAGKTLRS